MGRKIDETLELVREAVDQLRRGDIVDALTTLERTAYPKWESVEDSHIDYLMHRDPSANIGAVAARVFYPEEAAAAASEGDAP